jgi:hypothetical protein
LLYNPRKKYLKEERDIQVGRLADEEFLAPGLERRKILAVMEREIQSLECRKPFQI